MKQINITTLTIIFLLSVAIQSSAQKAMLPKVKNTMLGATKYMVEEVSTNGGYVGLYFEDLSRRWGELEAYKTMIWVQSPGTLEMGNLFLDAYNVTKDEYYYQAAKKTADAIVYGQHDTGGWNYMIDFAGDASLKQWYNTIGKNAWGFEEHNHYYGNATFDDEVTVNAAKFLLRIYLEKLDPAYKASLDKAINFILESQYPLGGWPQRYPLKNDHPRGGLSDYTAFYTFNDEVIKSNIDFLIDCYMTLGEQRFLDPISRGMNFYILSQQGNPQAGWGQQYDMDLKPAHARSYEPPALLPGQTSANILTMINFYELTGDKRFISRIPDAIEWLESVKLPASETSDGRYTHAVFVEQETNKTLYAHRTGTGVKDGNYWWDYNSANPLLHYGAKTKINIDRLKSEYNRVMALSLQDILKNSPLKANKERELPQRYFDRNKIKSKNVPTESDVESVISKIDSKYRWLLKHQWISRPYSVSNTGEETNTARYSDSGGRALMDQSDQKYISVREYLKNMNILIDYAIHQ